MLIWIKEKIWNFAFCPEFIFRHLRIIPNKIEVFLKISFSYSSIFFVLFVEIYLMVCLKPGRVVC